MYEKEHQRAVHVMILLCYTFFAFVLTGEAMLLGWNIGAVILILLGLVISWGVHIAGEIPENIRLWLYFALTMLTFFFYGIHETSILDLAPVMTVVILMYSAAEIDSIIWLCVATYFLTLLYDFVVVLGGVVEFTPLSVTRMMLHCAVVFVAGYLAKVIIGGRRRGQVQAEEKIAELQETNRRTEDLLTNVSHELRTPINAVTGITAVMLKNEEDENKRKDMVSIQNAGYRLYGQIEDILDYTEIDIGKLKLSEEVYMISSLINDIITGNQMTGKENGPELIFDIDAEIPSILVGDVKKIKKIIRHLIDNSVKFTPKGGVYIRMYALEKSYGINLCISVSDTGVGISEDDFERITEKFYQSSRGRNRKAGGLGLGLPIVHGLVTAMEGFMQIESAEGNGTTVSLSIPQKVGDKSPSMAVENKSELFVAVFLRLERYETPEVRKYYNEMISHLVKGLDISMQRVTDMNGLEKLVSTYELTHIFVEKEVYEENTAYFEDLDKEIMVIIVSNERFALPQGSRAILLQKPFYGFQITNILNGGGAKNQEDFEQRRIVCPNLRTLVVDDESMNLIVAEGIFKDYQMLVQTAESGKEAIKRCKTEEFDVIFLDHMMPEMDGIETLKQLRKLYTNSSKVPIVIAFTANAVSGAREMFLQEGFDEFITKPIDTLELERVLKKALPKSYIAYADKNTEIGDAAESVNEQEKRAEKQKEDAEKQKENAEKQEENVEKQKEDAEKQKENVGKQEEQSNRKSGKRESLQACGINVGGGLHYCRDDMEFYQELLIKFVKEEGKKEADIDKFYQQKDWDNYRIVVHALKSNAKMMGADLLSESARELEEAAKNHDEEYISLHHTALLSQYRSMTESVAAALDLAPDDSESIVSQNAAELSRSELIERLKELADCLDTFEAERAERLFVELCKDVYQKTAVGTLLEEVGERIRNFELDVAYKEVEELVERLERGGEYDA